MAKKKSVEKRQRLALHLVILVILAIVGVVLLAIQTANHNLTKAPMVNVTVIERNLTSAQKPVPSYTYPNFTEVYQFPDSSTNALVWADLNSDGWPDLVIGNFDEQTDVFYSNRSHNFIEKPLGFGKTRAIAAADFTGDGLIDLAIGSFGSDNLLFVNKGNEEFVQQTQFMEFPQASNQVTALAWADFNKDGFNDLAVGRDNEQNLLFINNGDGTFTLSKQFGLSHTTSLAWADINNDGYPDLIVGNFNDPSYIYLYNKTTGSLFTQLPFINPPTAVRAVAVGDFNLDGWPDIVVANYNQPSALYINNHDGTFNRTTPFGTCLAVDAAVADFNNDGWPDVAIACYNGQSYIYYNNGNLTFTAVPVFSKGYTHNLAVADYDKDGAADIAVGRYDQPTSLYQNQMYKQNSTQ